MHIVLASGNAHKRVEVQARLRDLGVSIGVLEDPPDPAETAETFVGNALIKALAFFDQLLVELAGEVSALASVRHGEVACLADDSGLLVDALDGAPGVYSARFARRAGSEFTHSHPPDIANSLHLLAQLSGVTQRSAHFHSSLVLVTAAGSDFGEWLAEARLPDGVLRLDCPRDDVVAVASDGSAHGTILEGRPETDADGRVAAGRGLAGFGYDPLFSSADLGITFAEATADEKNRVSHRSKALDGLRELLSGYFAATSDRGSDPPASR